MAKGKKKTAKAGLDRLQEAFSKNLVRLRIQMDLSRAELGARAGYSYSYVAMLEKGERFPTLETVEHFAAALNVKDARRMLR